MANSVTPTQDMSGPARRKRVRARNLAMLAILLGLVALFYAITIVKMMK